MNVVKLVNISKNSWLTAMQMNIMVSLCGGSHPILGLDEILQFSTNIDATKMYEQYY